MAQLKSYTDLEQSKKLAEILPFESADNTWERVIIPGPLVENINELKVRHSEIPFKLHSGIGYPCWSLAALLSVLPRPSLHQTTDKSWYCNAEPNRLYFSEHYDNPVDACYEMIIKLHEQNLI